MIQRIALLALTVSTLTAADLSQAVVVAPSALSPVEKKAAQVLVEEVAKRSRLQWPIVAAPTAGRPSITLRRNPAGGPADGFTIRTSGASVEILGNDERGTLFGAGRLLRELRMYRDSVILPDGFQITTAPKYKLRGHQLGYRPKTNSYDAWTAAMWDQYIRDLAIFGTNAVELIPPRSDDDADSPHFPIPQMPMMVEMSKILDSYGMDVWVWYPAMDRDYNDPATVTKAIDEWAEVFKKLPRLDAVMVPGGDPGHTKPDALMALLEKQAASLRKYHPKAQMWVSPQGFDQKWMDEFYSILDKQPAWLTGIVHGPQVRVSIQELRRRVPARYGIRNYPDITHSVQCQFAVPNWDAPEAFTHAREGINPRPTEMRAIFHDQQPSTIGFLTYSEGCNDDVNKILWSEMGWNPDVDLTAALREYARYFIDARFDESFAEGLLGLEKNWQGALATSTSVEPTFSLFQSLERQASPADLLNWRFQQALYRAYYDALNRRRWLSETATEESAMNALRDFPRSGSLAAMDAASRILHEPGPVSPLRQRVFELAEALYQSVRMQLSVERYKAIGRDRGATLDNIDTPFNNRNWLDKRFAAIRSMPDEPSRRNALREIVQWTDPGPGGFYDDLGNPAAQPHLVRPKTYEQDPGSLLSPRNAFARTSAPGVDWRISTMSHAEVMYDGPMEMLYPHLDPAASYKVRIIYGGEVSASRILRLTANGSFELHPFRKIENVTEPVEFEIPKQATASGSLRLRWEKTPGLPGNGRGTQVAEVWLIRQP
ncbi:MAG: hypothetical protein J0H49_10945 [Acidobacteria bacterium]|nr:hypothetical protein [Acidobacteriota bacterium]